LKASALIAYLRIEALRTVKMPKSVPDVATGYVNVFQVTSTREEIALLFGDRQPAGEDPEEVTARLKERIVLHPLTAKRLAMMLDSGIRDYESKYGPLETESLPSSEPGPVNLAWPKPSVFKAEIGGEKARLVLQLVEDLDIKFGYEKSFKIFENTLLANRFLLGFKKKRIRQEAHERILDICRRMDMPENLLQAYRGRLPDSNYLHFGFEENEKTCLCKAYLEFYDKVDEAMRSQPGNFDSFLMHLGFKWDALDNSKYALTRYSWYPFLPVEVMLERLSNILSPHEFGALFGITKGIVEIALGVVPPYDILYMEVDEENSLRKSFDINMYRARLPLSELQPWLEQMCRHYAIPSEEFQSLYEGVRDKTFGHIAGGIDREGRDFVTVYYGVEYKDRVTA
jgi:hypothetical protein